MLPLLRRWAKLSQPTLQLIENFSRACDLLSHVDIQGNLPNFRLHGVPSSGSFSSTTGTKWN